jgi:hypothetical protein
MVRRRELNQHEFNPLEEPRGRILIDIDPVRAVIAAKPEPRPVVATVTRLEDTIEEPVRPKKLPSLEKLYKYNKFLTTPSEKIQLERLATRITGTIGVSVKSSQLIRASLIQLIPGEEEIIKELGRAASISEEPSNAEPVKMGEYDHFLANVFSQAFRRAKPLDNRWL